MSDEKILLKIKRAYSYDESIKYLHQELSAARFKNGELLSENEELRHTNKLLNKELHELRKIIAAGKMKLTKEDLKEERFIELNKKVHTQNTTIHRLKKDVDTWRHKFCDLDARTRKT